MSMASNRIAAFHRLHEQGCFVIPNPWDVGSARILEGLGFKALASTSSGFAWTLGRQDNRVTLMEALDHIGLLAGAVSIPVNADLEDGFASEPERLVQSVQQAVATGIAGLSIEDSTRGATEPLYEFEHAVERVRAARTAIDLTRTEVMLTARTEGFIAGRPDLGETLRRLVAFSEAGADCLYAPGVRDLGQIEEIVGAVAPKPVNVLVSSGFTTMEELAAIGVRRISVGGALARTAWGGFLNAARDIADRGRFTSLDAAVAGSEVEEFFSPGRQR
jgi:methylisocitrate lyase